jgi:hypothetical protein
VQNQERRSDNPEAENTKEYPDHEKDEQKRKKKNGNLVNIEGNS